MAKALKRVREEAERERLRIEEDRKQREEERRRQEEYDRKAKVAGEFLRRWNESKAFRHFAAAIESVDFQSEGTPAFQNLFPRSFSPHLTRGVCPNGRPDV